MRTNFKKAIMPLAVVVLGAAAAFATNAAKQVQKQPSVVDHAYYYNSALPSGSRCVMVEVECLDGEGPICTDFANRQVWKTDVQGLTGCTGSLTRIGD
ncbi:MAG: DUF6520 family protein [Flavobacterium sp.]|uniref:DUF6520 family protein n=1 Tax=Flavobacterium sp. TaxID=239 RepID=UPI002FC94312